VAILGSSSVSSGGMRVVVVVVDFVMVLVCERGTWTARVFVGLSACLIGAEVWGCCSLAALEQRSRYSWIQLDTGQCVVKCDLSDLRYILIDDSLTP